MFDGLQNAYFRTYMQVPPFMPLFEEFLFYELQENCGVDICIFNGNIFMDFPVLLNSDIRNCLIIPRLSTSC